ncbi:OmpA family protein [Persicobacter psychrovividus]|uniref:Membrane protein n=1 Tax=Persicobacter psychrovividus TaxID=387638 RepID=A0ABN6L756_9BACT|nr:membrane protein [Persicobacter psychrovividus]
MKLLQPFGVALAAFCMGGTPAMAQHISQKSFDQTINSPHDDRSPVLSQDGKTLFFVRASDPQNVGGKKDHGDIWTAKHQQNGSWSAPAPLSGAVNNDQVNEILGLSADGKTMFVNDAYRQDGRTGIAVSQLKNGQWGKPEAVKLPYFKNASTMISGCLSEDGRVLILSMDSFNSRGAEDLYVLFKGKNGFGDPKNLGSTINSRFQEITPYLASDNKTLYFASNGHGGAGSFDLFKAERLDDSFSNWSAPENLGTDFNTNGKESGFQLITGGKQALYVSTQDSNGYGDIKVFTFPEPQQLAEKQEIKVEENTITEAPLAAPIAKKPSVDTLQSGRRYLQIWVVDAQTNDFLKEGVELQAVFADSTAVIPMDFGQGSVPLPNAQKLKEWKVKAKGYWGEEREINLPVTELAEAYRFKLEPLKVGANIRLSNILFKRGTAERLVAGDQELNKVVAFLKENPSMVIEVSGHTDNRGNSDANRKLSLSRAENVRDYLIEQGIKKNRVKAKGYGSTKPIASNLKEATRKLNRRVEFTILSE